MQARQNQSASTPSLSLHNDRVPTASVIRRYNTGGTFASLRNRDTVCRLAFSSALRLVVLLATGALVVTSQLSQEFEHTFDSEPLVAITAYATSKSMYNAYE